MGASVIPSIGASTKAGSFGFSNELVYLLMKFGFVDVLNLRYSGVKSVLGSLRSVDKAINLAQFESDLRP